MITANSPNLLDLSGRKILITGAAGGIGSTTAQLCAQHGARLVLVDIVSPEETAERVGDAGRDAEIYSLDMSRRSLVDEMAGKVGPIYGLIDTAAIAPFDDWMADDWEASLDRVIAVNVKGPINVTRAFFPGMIAQGEGRIVLCGSVAGWMGGVRSGPHYAFSKGGLHAFVRWLSRQGAPHNVLVNGIAPGPVDTAMTKGAGLRSEAISPRPDGHSARGGCRGSIPVQRERGVLSGTILDVDGGIHFH